MDANNIYTQADPFFYETISKYKITDTYKKVLDNYVPNSWSYKRIGTWLHVRSKDSSAPRQGFKIHISATIRNAKKILNMIVPECIKWGVNFKLAGDEKLLSFLTSKHCNRIMAGKFMTIYPSEEKFTLFIEDIYQKIKGQKLEGPYILSDARYKKSKIIHYRYGGIYPYEELNIDGTKSLKLKNKDGKLVQDNRIPHYTLPDWVVDPFNNNQINKPQKDWMLHERYKIESAITFSNSGGIYEGKDTQTGKNIIIKEARPLTNIITNDELFIDAEKLLKREYKNLLLLNDLDFTPEPIGIFKEWEHTFLVQQKVKGITFYSFWAKRDVILAPYVYDKVRLERVIPIFINIALDLIDKLNKIHGKEILIGDLSPKNILIDPETKNLTFIDFESAIKIDTEDSFRAFAAKWNTPGYNHPECGTSRSTLCKEDDYYALGMILYNAMIRINQLFYLKPDAKDLFMEKFIDLGLPRSIKKIIDCLLEGHPSSARKALNRMKKNM